MSAQQIVRATHMQAPFDDEFAYRRYVADVLLEYATESKKLENPEAYRRVMAITGRTLGTVKNWLAYRTNLPDLASLARMVEQWQIPPAKIFPPHLRSLLTGQPDEKSLPVSCTDLGANTDQVLISLYGTGDLSRIDVALSKYTDHPQRALLVKHEGGEMLDEIRPGELMLVDTGCEQINGSGIYLLRFAAGGGAPTTHARFVDVLVSEPSVRIRGGSATPSTATEQVPISNGTIHGVTVLGRVIGVLRQM